MNSNGVFSIDDLAPESTDRLVAYEENGVTFIGNRPFEVVFDPACGAHA